MGIPLWQFLLVDGIAALISVPTQVIAVAFYGEVILAKLREFKLILVAVIGALVLIYLLKRLYKYIQMKRVK